MSKSWLKGDKVTHESTYYATEERDGLYVVYSYVESKYEDGSSGPTFKNWVAEFDNEDDAIAFTIKMNESENG